MTTIAQQMVSEVRHKLESGGGLDARELEMVFRYAMRGAAWSDHQVNTKTLGFKAFIGEASGKLMYRINQNTSVACTCIAEPYVSQIVAALNGVAPPRDNGIGGNVVKSPATQVRMTNFASIADALMGLAETVGMAQQLQPGHVCSELVLGIACYVAKYAEGDTSEAIKNVVTDFPVVVALVEAHDFDLEAVRKDMVLRHEQVLS